jgi:hypothetical protein
MEVRRREQAIRIVDRRDLGDERERDRHAGCWRGAPDAT